MKNRLKIICTVVAVLLFASVANAQAGRHCNEVNVIGAIGGGMPYSISYIADYTYNYRVGGNAYIGAGVGFEWLEHGSELIGPGDLTKSFISVPVFVDLRYNLPLSKDKLYLTGVVDTGFSFGIGKEKSFSSSWIIVPQLGLKIKLCRQLYLNPRLLYRRIEKLSANMVGLNLGISF